MCLARKLTTEQESLQGIDRCSIGHGETAHHCPKNTGLCKTCSVAMRSSIHHFLEFLHGKCLNCLGGWLRLEDARLLGEGVHPLLRCPRWLLLELQVQGATKLEFPASLQLLRCHSNDTPM